MEGITNERIQWSEVWMQFKSGDPKAFSKIYEEFIDSLFAYGSKITSDRELLKDCIQDVFYNLYRYDIQLNHPEYLEFYLFRSLRNTILRKLCKSRKENFLAASGMIRFNLKFQAEQDHPDSEFDEIQLKTLLKILEALDSEKRELLFLKFYTGLSYGEIGQLLGINPDTAKRQVYRVLSFLRMRYGKQLLQLFQLSVKK
ncbi:MAG: sigma-70 family RNA polymerase sigma factor [Prolixibacteraceae bacterium]|nr:sigma-70 family RNA polymerase sigma factor [Prolixibacteraceae bacterium]